MCWVYHNHLPFECRYIGVKRWTSKTDNYRINDNIDFMATSHDQPTSRALTSILIDHMTDTVVITRLEI